MVVSSPSSGLQPPATNHGVSIGGNPILVRLLLTTVYLMFIILPSYVRMCHLVHYRRYTGVMRSLATGHHVLVPCCGTMILLLQVIVTTSCAPASCAPPKQLWERAGGCAPCAPPPAAATCNRVFPQSVRSAAPAAPAPASPAQLNVTLIFSFTGTSSSQLGASHSGFIAGAA